MEVGQEMITRGVLESNDARAIYELEIERASIIEVHEMSGPSIGRVWFRERINGGLAVWRACYDSSG